VTWARVRYSQTTTGTSLMGVTFWIVIGLFITVPYGLESFMKSLSFLC
jgi:hypothetical protein